MIKREPAALTESDKTALLDEVPQTVRRLKGEISKVIIGQREVVDQIIIALVAGGHSIIRGVPGLAKTLIIKTIASAMDLAFKRIQFTPDLMPSDILGTEVIEEDHATGRRVARFIPGPIFANMILADEINRTPPKTQAALLEAMQEHQVTVSGIRYDLGEPFFVLATQNPIELEGTYPLPEAQLDRFLFNIEIDYPARDEEMIILAETTSAEHAIVSRVIDARRVSQIQQLVRDIPAASNIINYVTRLIRASRPGTDEALPFTDEWVKWGAGPRAGQAFLLGAKARALLDGRYAVSFDDARDIAYPVLRHRIIMNFHAEA
ncbi:MAG TPA: MoxR family ATPase, partial [Blastocatellia bacterium]|nr:MoxR family ATPase [Blastocatellia bacterium]